MVCVRGIWGILFSNLNETVKHCTNFPLRCRLRTELTIEQTQVTFTNFPL